MDGLDEFQKLCCPKPQICCIMVSVNLMNQHAHRLFTMTAQLRRDERRSGCFCCSLFSPPGVYQTSDGLFMHITRCKINVSQEKNHALPI